MNIMKLRPLFYLISLTLILFSVFSIAKWGFKTSIDFSGGSVWDLTLPSKPSGGQIENMFKTNNIELLSFTTVGENNYSLKFKNITHEEKTALDNEIKKIDENFQELKFETLGPVLGKELLRKTITAVILSSIFLLLFIGRRFKDMTFGVSAIVAILHDTLILLGSFSVLGHFLGAELNSLFVTALLTTLATSIHDTVVTFDRIRELKRSNFKLEWVSLANQAVTETLTRSINNSMTIVFMLLSLVILGGVTTRWFAAALLIGVICGTYSSIGVAIPLVLFWKRKQK